MTYSYQARTTATGTGAQTVFTLSFPYLQKSHLNVTVDGVALSQSDFEVSGSSLTFDTAPGSGAAIVIERSTSPHASLVVFTDATRFNATAMNLLRTQHLYLSQEAQDRAELAYAEALLNGAASASSLAALVSANAAMISILNTLSQANETGLANLSQRVAALEGQVVIPSDPPGPAPTPVPDPVSGDYDIPFDGSGASGPLLSGVLQLIRASSGYATRVYDTGGVYHWIIPEAGELAVENARRIDHANATDYGWGADGIEYKNTDENGAVLDSIKGVRPRPQSVNVAKSNRNMNQSPWIKIGSAVATPLTDARVGDFTRLSGISNGGVGEIYQAMSTVGATAAQEVAFLMRRNATSGVISFEHRYNSSFGQWDIDLSLISNTDFELIDKNHAAVTVNNAITSDAGGIRDYTFRYPSITPTQTFDVTLFTLVAGTNTILGLIENTSTTLTATVSADYLRATAATEFNDAAGSLILDTFRDNATVASGLKRGLSYNQANYPGLLIAGDGLTCRASTGTVNLDSTAQGSYDPLQGIRVGMCWDGTDFRTTINGLAVTTSVNVMPSLTGALQIGDSGGGNAHSQEGITRVRYFARKVTDQELIDLTYAVPVTPSPAPAPAPVPSATAREALDYMNRVPDSPAYGVASKSSTTNGYYWNMDPAYSSSSGVRPMMIGQGAQDDPRMTWDSSIGSNYPGQPWNVLVPLMVIFEGANHRSTNAGVEMTNTVFETLPNGGTVWTIELTNNPAAVNWFRASKADVTYIAGGIDERTTANAQIVKFPAGPVSYTIHGTWSAYQKQFDLTTIEGVYTAATFRLVPYDPAVSLTAGGAVDLKIQLGADLYPSSLSGGGSVNGIIPNCFISGMHDLSETPLRVRLCNADEIRTDSIVPSEARMTTARFLAYPPNDLS